MEINYLKYICKENTINQKTAEKLYEGEKVLLQIIIAEIYMRYLSIIKLTEDKS